MNPVKDFNIRIPNNDASLLHQVPPIYEVNGYPRETSDRDYHQLGDNTFVNRGVPADTFSEIALPEHNSVLDDDYRSNEDRYQSDMRALTNNYAKNHNSIEGNLLI